MQIVVLNQNLYKFLFIGLSKPETNQPLRSFLAASLELTFEPGGLTTSCVSATWANPVKRAPICWMAFRSSDFSSTSLRFFSTNLIPVTRSLPCKRMHMLCVFAQARVLVVMWTYRSHRTRAFSRLRCSAISTCQLASNGNPLHDISDSYRRPVSCRHISCNR